MDTSAHRGDSEGGLASTQEEHGGGQSDKNPDTVLVAPTTHLGQPTAPDKTDEMGIKENDEKILAFDERENLLVPWSTDVAIDDPDGNGELALGGNHYH